MFSTPLICCSSGAITVSATTSALAPGYCPLTLTTGAAAVATEECGGHLATRAAGALGVLRGRASGGGRLLTADSASAAGRGVALAGRPELATPTSRTTLGSYAPHKAQPGSPRP